jgi:hypothetical protein
MGLAEAIEHVKNNVQGIEAFNVLTHDKGELKFCNPSDERYFRKLLEKWGVGKSLNPNAVNLAFSLEMAEEFGKFRFGGNDSHLYRDIRFDLHVHVTGQVATVFDFSQFSGKPSAERVVKLMTDSTERRAISAFVPFVERQGKIDLPAARTNRTLIQSVYDSSVEHLYYFKAGVKIARDAVQQIKALAR